MTQVANALTRTRTQLLLNQPFFAVLAMRLQAIETTSVETASTNGVWLKWNPEYFAALSEAEREFLVAHEVMHCALLHPYRRNGRDMQAWNQACDYAVNGLLKKAGFALIKDGLYDPQYDGMSAEAIYSKRNQQNEDQDDQSQSGDPAKGDQSQGGEQAGDDASENQSGGSVQPEVGNRSTGAEQGENSIPTQGEGDGNGQGSGEPNHMPGCPTGDFQDAGTEPAEVEGEMAEQDWQLAAEEATRICSAAGTMPGDTGVALKSTRDPVVDWVQALRDYVVHTMASGQSWSTPNRRFIGGGSHLPGMRKENTGRVVLAIDVSGSTGWMRSTFANEFVGIMQEARPEVVDVIYWDATVQRHDEFTADDVDVDMQTMGNGGTVIGPVFTYMEEKEIAPDVMVVLTDLDIGGYPAEEPSFPVLWCAPVYAAQGRAASRVPFGEVMPVLEVGR